MSTHALQADSGPSQQAVAGTPGWSAAAEARRARKPEIVGWARLLVAIPLILIIAAAIASAASELWLGFAVLVFLCGALYIWHVGSETVRSSAWRLRRQAAVERRVADQLRQLPWGDWAVLHDRRLPSHFGTGNIDHIVVGPPGAVVLVTARHPRQGDQNLLDAGVAAVSAAGLAPVHGIAVLSHAGAPPSFLLAELRGRIAGRTSEAPRPSAARTTAAKEFPAVQLTDLVAELRALPPALDRSAVDAQTERAAQALPACASPATAAFAELDRGGSLPLLEVHSRHADNGEHGDHPVAPLAPLRPSPPPRDEPPVDLSDPERINKILARFDSWPGLESVAGQVRDMTKRVMRDQQRREVGLAVEPMEVHAIFAGPPGTGKTMVARVWANVLCALGRLPTNEVTEASRPDFVAGYIGQTADKTRALLDDAKGGVLFIDEAYALVQGHERDFGHEAVAELVKYMEDQRGDLCVIAAGYEGRMDEFLDSNPGLRSRFAHTVSFSSYSAEALVQVAQSMAHEGDYRFNADAIDLLRTRLTALVKAPPRGWANARSVRNVFDRAKDAQSLRPIESDDIDALRTLTRADVEQALDGVYPRD